MRSLRDSPSGAPFGGDGSGGRRRTWPRLVLAMVLVGIIGPARAEDPHPPLPRAPMPSDVDREAARSLAEQARARARERIPSFDRLQRPAASAARDALAQRPQEYIEAMILRGRAGTAMPAWQGLLDASDAQWISRQLKNGFPDER